MSRGFAPILIIAAVAGIITLGLVLSRDSLLRPHKSGEKIVKTIVSQNGNFKVEIPESSLPANTNVNDITIEQVKEDQISKSSPFGTPWIGPVYRLGPSGLKFNKPIIVTTNLQLQQETKLQEAEESRLIIPWIIDDNQDARPLDGKSEQKIIDDDSITITSEVSHFSNFGYAMYAPVVKDGAEVRLLPYHSSLVYKVPIGWPVDGIGFGDLSFQFYSIQSTSGWFANLDSPSVSWYSDNTYLKEGWSEEQKDLEIKSQDMKDPSPPPKKLKRYYGEASQPFFCQTAGLGWMAARVNFRLFWDNIDQTKMPYYSDHVIAISKDIDCIEKPDKDKDDELFSKQFTPSPFKSSPQTQNTPTPISSIKESGIIKTIGFFSGTVGTTEVTLFPHPGITVSDYTPLKVEVKAGGKLVWQTIINKSDCKETASFPGCNVPGYKYNSDWDGLSLEMKTYDQDGILRASSYTKVSTPWRPKCTGSDCPPPFAQPLP